jgi:hypothetical protein
MPLRIARDCPLVVPAGAVDRDRQPPEMRALGLTDTPRYSNPGFTLGSLASSKGVMGRLRTRSPAPATFQCEEKARGTRAIGDGRRDSGRGDR